MDKVQLESDVDVKEFIVIDNGTETIKIGVSGEDYPRIVIDSITGNIISNEDKDQKQTHLFGQALKEAMNPKASEQKVDLEFKNLISRGQLIDEKIIKELYDYAIVNDGLQVSEITAQHFLIVDNPGNSKEYKVRVAEMLFDELKISSLIFMDSSVLSLLSTGETTGLVIEAGHGVTSVTPIFESYPIHHACQQIKLGGQDITEQLNKELLESGLITQYKKYDYDHFALIKDIKEKLAFVSSDYNSDINSATDKFTEEEKSYELRKCAELPDGQIIKLDKKLKINSSELLFNPKLVNAQCMSLSEMIEDSFSRCDLDLQHELLKNITLSGGVSTTKGFLERIKREFNKIIPKSFSRSEFDYHADSLRKYAAWIGGSMVASMSTFQALAIQRTEFDENPEGKASIIAKKTI